MINEQVLLRHEIINCMLYQMKQKNMEAFKVF